MAELASVKPYQLVIPDNNAFYAAPRLNLHDYNVSEFTAPYAFGPHLTGHEWDNASAALDNGIARVGQRFSPEGQAQASAARLAKANSDDALAARNWAKEQPIYNSPTALPIYNLSDGSPVTTSGPLSSIQAANNGVYTGTGTVFAGPKDIANFNRTGSLATGDNGIGAWGENTTDPNVPLVAVKPSILKENGIDPSKAAGIPVSVNVNGQTVQAKIGDRLGDNSPSGALIDLNPGVAKVAKIDPDNFKGPVSFALNSTASGTMPLFPLQPNVAQPHSQSFMVSPNAATQAFNSAPVAIGQSGPLANVPRQVTSNDILPPSQGQSPWLQQLTSAYGAGHPTINANGTVGYETVAPLSAAQQQLNAATLRFKQAEADRDDARAQREIQLANQHPTGTETVVGPDGKAQILLFDKATGKPISTLGNAPVKAGGNSVPKATIADANSINAPTDGKTADEVAQSIADTEADTGKIRKSLRPAAIALQNTILKDPDLHDYRKIRQAYHLFDNAYQKGADGGFSDMFLTEGAQRIANPGAIVRQGTIQNMQQAAGWLQSFDPSFQWNKAIQGNKFSDAARARLHDLVQSEYEGATARVLPQLEGMKSQATTFGVPNPDTFVDNVFKIPAEEKEVASPTHSPSSVKPDATQKQPFVDVKATPDNMVQMRSPSGKLGNIPADKVKDAQNAGFTLAQ